MTEEQRRLIERMGMDPEDNREFLEGFETPQDAVHWFLTDGWPRDWEPPTEEDREALEAYATS